MFIFIERENTPCRNFIMVTAFYKNLNMDFLYITKCTLNHGKVQKAVKSRKVAVKSHKKNYNIGKVEKNIIELSYF